MSVPSRFLEPGAPKATGQSRVVESARRHAELGFERGEREKEKAGAVGGRSPGLPVRHSACEVAHASPYLSVEVDARVVRLPRARL